MSTSMIDILNKIYVLLQSCLDESESALGGAKDKKLRTVILSIGDLCQELSQYSQRQEQEQEQEPQQSPPHLSPTDFSQWLGRVHDFLLLRDAGLRSVLLRAIRLSLLLPPSRLPQTHASTQSPPAPDTASLSPAPDSSSPPPPCPLCALVVSHNIHLVAIHSLEKEHNSNWERMQALKLMKRMLEVSPASFPLAMARSFVAIAQHSPEPSTSSSSSSSKQMQDSCRNICVEMLRELALANVEVAYQSGALKVMFDIILSPETGQGQGGLVEPLLMTVLFLLNKPHTRRFIRPYLDLQWLLSPFTDLESQPAIAVLKGSGGGREELNPAAKKLQAAKFAFVSLMKSWGGIIALASDDTGLLAIVRLLSDSEVSNVVKETILDCISEICEPIVTKLEFNKTNSVKNVTISNPSTTSTPTSSASISSPSKAGGVEDGSFFDDGQQERGSLRVNRTSRSSTNPEPFLKGHNGSVRFSPGSFRKHRRSSLQISSIVNHSREWQKERAEGEKGDQQQRDMGMDVLESQHERTMSGRWKSGSGNGSLTGLDMLRNQKDSTISKPLSVWTRFTSHAELAEKFSVDPIYNMLDNYAGVLCAAFMHVKLFDALCWLGTNGDDYISSRGKDLLVDLMGVVNKVCTEKVCSDLLTLPSLIEFAANSANVKQRNDRSYKASDMLKSLSNAFSVSKRKDISIYSANPTVSFNLNKTGSLSAFAVKSKISQVEVRRRTNVNIANLQVQVGGRPLNSVTEELLQCAVGGEGGRSSNTKSALVYELKMFLSDASLDKSEFNKQMESSRVLGKEGKEPFRWDWAVLGDMLDYSFTTSSSSSSGGGGGKERLVDALKTKWVKRLCGFFRCAVEEKGYFANLEWEPGHLQYFDCSCQLYSILTTQEAAYSFMNADRRGMLFTEIVRDLEAVISQCLAPSAPASSSSSSSSAKSLHVFRLASCQQSMAREYFALIGRTSVSPFGRQLINKSHLYDILVQTGSHAALDYLSRNVLTSLSFTDGGFISKDLMQIYLTSGASSTNLRLYSHSLLRALLRSRSAEVCDWGIEVMVQQMMFLHVPRKLIVHCMEEAAQDRVYLGQLIRSEPDLQGADMDNLSIRFLALPEGFHYLTRLGWVEDELQRWQERKCRAYSARVEVGLAKALNSTYLRRQQSQLVRPIPLQVSAFSQHPSAPHGLRYPDGGVDLEGLLRLPLNIEAKVASPHQLAPGASSKESAPRYIRLDSYLDTSELRCPASNEMTSDTLRTVKVRGIVLNAKGEPGGFPVLNDRSLLSCLLCGTCPVSKEGRVGLSANNIRKHNSERTSSDGSSDGGGGGSGGLGGSASSSASVSKSSNMSIQARRHSIAAADKSASAGDTEWYKDQPADVPMSALNSAIHDWTTCKPSHRTAPRRLPVPGSPHKYTLEIPGEPAVFVFSTQPPQGFGSSSINSQKASAAVTFLVEIHYVLSLKTGQAAFLPLPRHLYGEMARTSEGRVLLASRRIVSTLLHHVERYEAGICMYVPSSPLRSRSGDSGDSGEGFFPPRPPFSTETPEDMAPPSSSPPPTADIISSLWALGHISAIEEGFQSILDVSPRFVPACIGLATDALSYSVRACAFSVLGLVSRTESGSGQLAAHHWQASPIHYVAVAMPDDPSVLFRGGGQDGDDREGDSSSTSRLLDPSELAATMAADRSEEKAKKKSSENKVPFSVDALKSSIMGQKDSSSSSSVSSESAESKLLEAIGRLPGQLLYKDTLASIKEMKRSHPEIFSSRRLFLSVHRLLENYTFKLSIRRHLLDLFTVAAKKKGSDE